MTRDCWLTRQADSVGQHFGQNFERIERVFFAKMLGHIGQGFLSLFITTTRVNGLEKNLFLLFFRKISFWKKGAKNRKNFRVFGPEPEMDPKRRKNPEIEDATLNTLTRTFAMDMNFRKVIGLVTQTSTKHRFPLPLKKNQKIWAAIKVLKKKSKWEVVVAQLVEQWLLTP